MAIYEGIYFCQLDGNQEKSAPIRSGFKLSETDVTEVIKKEYIVPDPPRMRPDTWKKDYNQV